MEITAGMDEVKSGHSHSLKLYSRLRLIKYNFQQCEQ